MILWLGFALMTAAAIAAVLWPLSRGRASSGSGSDLAVYRDQLAEIDRDRANGLIGDAEAEAARVEVSRRLIAAADAPRTAPDDPAGAPARFRRRATALAALIALPIGAGAVYLALGSPSLPGQPLAARLALPPDHRSIEEMVARIEAHLEQNPDDGRGWEILAPVYLRMGRFDDAVRARRNSIRLNGSTADGETELGEALTAAASGVVTADAKASFARAVALDPNAVKARYFLGLAAEQDGKPEEAAHIWHALIDAAAPDAPWVNFVRQSLARVEKGTVVAPPPAAAPSAPVAQAPSVPVAQAPGPTTADVAAAQEMTPEQRQEMIRGMVARLAERLKAEGGDPDGWLRLVRAYVVLGDRAKALDAVADARRALGADAQKLQRFENGVKSLGLAG